jgi:hypothetical protein
MFKLLILFLFSFCVYAEDLTTNVYNKVITGTDYVGNQYLVISSDTGMQIYSTTQLYTKNNRVRSIILSVDDFDKLVKTYR